jgi:DNA-binding LacI/PurR family transcriptional regulator
MLNTASTEPLYEHVKRQLLNYIATEKPKMLPAEPDLMHFFKVSRNTIRRAVYDLSSIGVLKPVRGRGTFVMKHMANEASDIGVICTDELSTDDPWISSMILGLHETSHAKNYHLNLFFCHDFSINELNNSAYSYLINSGKLAGLILLSTLEYKEVAYLQNIGLPFVTAGFKYCNLVHPSVLFDYLGGVEKIIDEYVNVGISRFAIVAHSHETLPGTKRIGKNDLIIENWATCLRKRALPVTADYFDLNITAQVKEIYTLPQEQRPQVIFSSFINDGLQVDMILSELHDWNPIHIKTEMEGDESGEIALIENPAGLAVKSFSVLDDIIRTGKSVEIVKYPVRTVLSKKIVLKQTQEIMQEQLQLSAAV